MLLEKKDKDLPNPWRNIQMPDSSYRVPMSKVVKRRFLK
jgi:hypothetical protein